MNSAMKRRLERTLGELHLFKRCVQLTECPNLVGHESPLEEDENLLGVYKNCGGGEEIPVLFSDLALHWLVDGKWHSVRYRDLVDVDRPAGDKMKAAELLLETRLGTTERLPVRGGTAITRDVYTVWTFLLRIMEDLYRADRAAGSKGPG